jgi:hypothetical protein
MGVLDNVFDHVAAVMPEKRFASFQIQAATAFLIKRVDRPLDFCEAQLRVASGGDLAVPASEITLIGQHESTNQGSMFPEQMMTQHVIDAKYYRFHGLPC